MKALIYQLNEWNPQMISTKYPAFPVESITQKALDVWKLKADEVLLIAATDASIRAAENLNLAVAAYVNPAIPGQSYAGAGMVIEGFEEVDDVFLQRIYDRHYGLPWEIARTDRCIIRELTLLDLPALEALYQKEGVCWRRDAQGRKIPGFLEPLYEPEEEKRYQQAYISNMYRYYGYGMWLVFDKETQTLIGRAGIEHREFPQTDKPSHEEPETAVELELGYLIDPDWQGQGLAAEVCRAVLTFAREELEAPWINALTDPENKASLALLQKLGFYYLEEMNVSGNRMLRYVCNFS